MARLNVKCSHAKPAPTVTAAPVLSAAATATGENPIRSNQADFGHSSLPINEIGTNSASASPNDDHSAVVAKIAPDRKGDGPRSFDRGYRPVQECSGCVRASGGGSHG